MKNIFLLIFLLASLQTGFGQMPKFSESMGTPKVTERAEQGHVLAQANPGSRNANGEYAPQNQGGYQACALVVHPMLPPATNFH
jgi:hypothetical protein